MNPFPIILGGRWSLCLKAGSQQNWITVERIFTFTEYFVRVLNAQQTPTFQIENYVNLWLQPGDFFRKSAISKTSRSVSSLGSNLQINTIHSLLCTRGINIKATCGEKWIRRRFCKHLKYVNKPSKFFNIFTRTHRHTLTTALLRNTNCLLKFREWRGWINDRKEEKVLKQMKNKF